MNANDIAFVTLDIEDSDEIKMTIKKGALIPGYDVSTFLGVLAFSTLGLIFAIRRRK